MPKLIANDGSQLLLQGEEVSVGRAALQCLALDLGEETHGAVFDAIPEGGVEASVEGDGVGVPGPPKVIGKLVEASDGFGDGRENGQTAKNLHVGGCSSPSRRGRDATRRCVRDNLMQNRIFYCIKPFGGGQFNLTP